MLMLPRIPPPARAAMACLALGGSLPAALTDLLITEIHYHAPETPSGGAETYEFIEFHNPTAETMDLSGVGIVSGVSYTFPGGTLLGPGAFVVVPANLNNFNARYRTPGSPWYHPGITATGQFASGKLDNAGEQIVIVSPGGVTLIDLTYGDGGDWPSLADGNGPSAELRDPGAAPAGYASRMLWLNDGDNWRSTALLHGTPGRAAEEPAIDIEISEVLAHSDAAPGLDWIELHNDDNAELTGLADIYISDSASNLARTSLGTHIAAIPADGYAALTQIQLGFALSELGDDVYVSQILPNGRTYLLDHIDFSETDRDVTMGLYRRTDGEKELTALSAPSYGAPNAYPFISPVVISEIMYAPLNGIEYIELTNRTGAPVPLHDPAHPANTWRFTSGITYTFPPGIVLAPHESLILCNTSPAAFRVAYPVAPEVRILGPWDLDATGTALLALNNSGETLRLRRPGPPQPDLVTVPMVIMEKLGYRSAAPWPAGADATGLSIERLTLYGYGNDGANWAAAAPSPGVATGRFQHMDLQVAPTAANLRIGITTIPGRRYDFQVGPDPAGPWTLWQTITPPGTSAVVESPLADPQGAPRRFFRVLWQAQSRL